jgi:hypothetical protein
VLRSWTWTVSCKWCMKYSETSMHRSRYHRFPSNIVCLVWSRNLPHINNTISSRLHRSSNYSFTALIVEKSRSWCSSFPHWSFVENWNDDLVAYEGWMRDDVHWVRKIECARVFHAFLAPPAAKTSYLHPFLSGYSSSWVFYSHSHNSPHFTYQTAAFPVGALCKRLFA